MGPNAGRYLILGRVYELRMTFHTFWRNFWWWIRLHTVQSSNSLNDCRPDELTTVKICPLFFSSVNASGWIGWARKCRWTLNDEMDSLTIPWHSQSCRAPGPGARVRHYQRFPVLYANTSWTFTTAAIVIPLTHTHTFPSSEGSAP